MKNAISQLADRYPFATFMAVPLAWCTINTILIIITHR
jgi:hypothetical protein